MSSNDSPGGPTRRTALKALLAVGAGGSLAAILSSPGSDQMANTTAAPSDTLESDLEQANPGDVITVEPGVHQQPSDQAIVPTGVSGTRSDPIHVVAEGDPAIFRWDGGASWNASEGLRVRDCEWIEFENIVVKESAYFGFRSENSSNISYINCEGRNNGLSGLYLTNGSESCRVIGGAYHDNTGINGSADGIGMSGGGSGGHVFIDVDIYGNGDDGCDNYDVPTNVWIDCRAWDNGRPGGNGVGYKLGIDPEADNAVGNDTGGHLVHNCLSWNNASRGFDYNNANLPITVNHCTAWNNDNPDYRFSGAAHVLRNNVQSSREGVQIGSECIEERNSWNIASPDPQFASTDPTNERFLIPTASAYIGTGSTQATIPDRITYPISPPNIGPYVPVENSDGESDSPAYDGLVEDIGASAHEFATNGVYEGLN